MRDILKANRKLVSVIGKEVAEKGAITGDRYYEIIEALKDEGKDDKYRLTPERLMRAREEVSLDYYKNIVLKEAGE